MAQALAAGIQIYALFGELGKSERIITLMVLVVTSIQIVLNRPKPASASALDAPVDPPGDHRSGTALDASAVRAPLAVPPSPTDTGD